MCCYAILARVVREKTVPLMPLVFCATPVNETKDNNKSNNVFNFISKFFIFQYKYIQGSGHYIHLEKYSRHTYVKDIPYTVLPFVPYNGA